MNCSDLEILLADYVDGTIHGEQRSAIEEHLAACPACGELARDASAAVAFMERAADVEAPPELVTRLLFEMTNGPSRAAVKPSLARRAAGKLLGSWGERLLQPKFSMSIAMTILSFAMLGRFAGIERQLTPSDLDPVKVWAAVEDRGQRIWERTVKYYENLRVVYEIQTQLKDWTDQADANNGGQSNNGQPKAADQK
jgi:anti-sigma factor RsiW